MRHNVLIVDDEQLIRQGLRARIEYLGIDVDEIFEADNGLMALGIQDEHPIDLVITDIRMPDMDGLELIQEMQKKNNQIKFIVLSGYAEFSYAETAIRLGVKAYLLKPVSNDDLKDAFDKAYQEMEQTASIRQEVQMNKTDGSGKTCVSAGESTECTLFQPGNQRDHKGTAVYNLWM